MVKLKKQLVSEHVIDERSYGYGNPVNTITIHQTGNTNAGADAQAHANIQTNMNSRQASWHYSVDDKEAIQSFPDNVQCWHATDGGGPGNTTSLSIELCINSDGDYEKTVQNGAELAKELLDKHHLTVNDLRQHHDWYAKNCPAQIRAGKHGIRWNDFLNMVQGKSVQVDTKVKAAFKSKKGNLTVDGKWGNATTTALQEYLDTVVDGIISDQVHNHVTEAFYGDTIDFGDGDEGSLVIKHLQRKIGTKADGLLGPNTIGALQKYLGTVYDKKLSRPSLVVKELQRRLNKGNL
ncbi:N-acetylmuramoyl-L-alanine amidase CwlH [Paraliobacillus ryukyuensis]|uniref:N-acetylmuramoyl-L-alanine amidase n=1 Tax=Paraliobacillus ryukyuensis TaxID=200904 RepID=A0A366DKY3_9BACI|nr:N-acetylmuramoyl-L-alanine amidase [Paraliobacillus ryukyuensis]RBO90595.1 N-acetylmuramoyl-L-alanine amidase CwlA [Paraliobacillus ryukyuensis]